MICSTGATLVSHALGDSFVAGDNGIADSLSEGDSFTTLRQAEGSGEDDIVGNCVGGWLMIYKKDQNNGHKQDKLFLQIYKKTLIIIIIIILFIQE